MACLRLSVNVEIDLPKLRIWAGALVALASAVLMPALARAEPRVPTHVACVGDSITAGYGSSTGTKTYPAVLKTLLGSNVQVMNFGHSGATLLSAGDLPYVNQSEYTAATSFVAGAGANAVVDVIIMLGTNDTKSYNWSNPGGGTRAAQYKTDYTAMVDHFAGLATHPVVYVALPLAIFSNSFGITDSVLKDEINPLLLKLAQDKGLPTIDLYAATKAHSEYFGDGVHPTDAGYAVVAQVMHDGLLRVPSVSVTSPLAGASIFGTTVNLSASASGGTVPISSIEFLQGTTRIASVSQTPFEASWKNVAPGSYNITAKATDATGASATSTPVAITVSGGDGAAGGMGAGGMTNVGGAGAAMGGAAMGGAAMGGATAGGVATGGTGPSAAGGAVSATGGVANGSDGSPGSSGAGASAGARAGAGGDTSGTGAGGRLSTSGGAGGLSSGGALTAGASGAGAVPSSSDGCACALGKRRDGDLLLAGLALAGTFVARARRRARSRRRRV